VKDFIIILASRGHTAVRLYNIIGHGNFFDQWNVHGYGEETTIYYNRKKETMKISKYVSTIVLVFITISACTQETNSPLDIPAIDPLATSTTSPAITATLPLANTETSMPDTMQHLIDRAISDVSHNIDISKEAIKVVSVEPIEWPDASLGCPQPGMFYAQVITPGYQIELGVDGKNYFAHTDLTSRVTICENPSSSTRPSLQPPKDADDRNPSQPIDPAPSVITD
jgi:hypothetical protein